MKVYVVCEDYTCAFYGVFTDKAKAEAQAEEIGGFINICDPETDPLGEDEEI